MKDMILDKALDGLVNLVFSKSSEEIKEILNKNCNQKLLADTIKKFVESDVHNVEFLQLQYIGNCESIMAISNDDISVTLTIEELISRNSTSIKECFVGIDGEFEWTSVLNYIICQYKRRAALNTSLGDILKSEQVNAEKLLLEIGDVKGLFVKADKYREEEEKRNNQIYTTYLKHKVNKYIYQVSTRFISFITKRPFSCSGNVSEYELYGQVVIQLRNIIDKMEEFVEIDFYKKPVKIMTGPKPNSLEAAYEDVECYEYAEIYVKNQIMVYFMELMLYRSFVDISFFSMMLEINMIIDNNMDFSIYSSALYNHIKNSTLTGIVPAQGALRILGMSILKLEKYYIQ